MRRHGCLFNKLPRARRPAVVEGVWCAGGQKLIMRGGSGAMLSGHVSSSAAHRHTPNSAKKVKRKKGGGWGGGKRG